MHWNCLVLNKASRIGKQHFIPCAAVVFVPHFRSMVLRGVFAAQGKR